MTAGLRAWLDLFSVAELVDDVDHGLWGEVFKVVVVDLDHGSVGAGTEALDFDQGKLLVLGGLTGLDAELSLESLEDLCGATAAEHARGGGAELQKVLSDGLAVEHGVESGDLVYAHRRHLEELGDIVHDRDRDPTRVLALTEVEQWDDGGLLVLLGVVRDDLLCHLLVLLVKLKGDIGVVVVGVAVDKEGVGRASCRGGEGTSSNGPRGAAGDSNSVGASRSGGDGSHERARGCAEGSHIEIKGDLGRGT